MKISARNVLAGTIVATGRGAVTSHVRIDAGGTIVTAAVDSLALNLGQEAFAVVKASDVMVGVA